MSLLFAICLIYFAYNFTLLSYLTIDQKYISDETIHCSLSLLFEVSLLKQSKERKPRG
jgi:hypothetical protein